MRRSWSPCRVCGREHTNPNSSSICAPCGAKERADREAAEANERRAYEESPFGQFMRLSEENRWRALFERIEALEVRDD